MKNTPDPQYDCLNCPEDKMCCRLSAEEFADYRTLDNTSQLLLSKLINAGNSYPTARRKVETLNK